jgi:hypothetical protein
MSLKDRIINSLEERKKKIEEGSINCIPLPFTRFRQELPGIEQGNYYLISGATKSGKSQLTNYLFIYNTVLYKYYNPSKLYPKIFYFHLEETAESITLRFISFLLSFLTQGAIRISPIDLKSTDERKPVPQKILDFMNTNQEFKDIMDLYENIVTFYDDRNPTGVWKTLTNYAKNNGTTVTKTIKIKETDELGKEKIVDRDIFDYYISNNPEEYVFIIVDHVSLLESERGKDLRETINKLSEYMIILRNRYHYIPVIVQQQSAETQNINAVKEGKIRPTVTGLSDSKYTARDCNIMIGITNPHTYEFEEYKGYRIKDYFKGNARFMEVVINRDGTANGICPLFFDGAINSFKELPTPDKTTEIEKYLIQINNWKKAKAFFMWAKHLFK